MRRRRRRRDSGAAAVEFALIAIPFFVLVIGMIQYGWYFYVSQSTGGAASNVARRLQVGDCWSGTQALDLARSQAPTVDSVDKVPATMPTSTGTQLTITVQAHGKIIGFLPLPNSGVVTKTIHATLEDTTATTC